MSKDEGQNPIDGADEVPAKSLGRRRLLGMLTAGGGIAAAGLVPGAWRTPVADVLATSSAGAQALPSPTPTTSVSPTPSVSVSLTTSPPPPTPSPTASAQPAGAVRAAPDFAG